MNATQNQTAVGSKWFLLAMGPLFCIQGIDNLARRHDIPFGVVQLAMGGVVMFSLLRKKPVATWIRAAILTFWVVAGVADIALGRWVWGLFIVGTGLLTCVVIYDERRRTSAQ